MEMLYRSQEQYEKLVREGRVECLYTLVENEDEVIYEVELDDEVMYITVTNSK